MAFTRETVEQLSSERSEPAWLREARQQAWQQFEATPMPDSTKDEDWRRTDVSKLDLQAFSPSLDGANTPALSVNDVPLPAQWERLGEGAPSPDAPPRRRRHPHLASPASGRGTVGLPPGVIFTSLEQAVRDCPDLVREHLAETDGKFLSLNAALWAGGAFVYVPPDVQVELPLVATFGDGAEAVFPRTLIVVDRGASLLFVDHFAAQDDDRETLSSASTHIVVKDGARLSYVSLQERSQRTWHFSTERAVVGREARVDVVIAALGGSVSKSYVETVLTGAGGEANLVGLVLTDGQQHIDHQTLQEHLAPHTTSNLLLKSAVKGSSQSIFAGLVRMPREAQQSDAFQEARALLLSDQARADAIPKLEIVASDVRCTHAGAIGQVDAEQKFYLMSRGIPEEEAERLIVTGFFEPALERIPVETVRESTRKALAHRISSSPTAVGEAG